MCRSVMVLFFLAAAVHAAEVRQSNFGAATDTKELSDWKLTAGQYRLQDGWLIVTSDKTNPEAVWNARLDGDGTFRATVRNARHCHRAILQAKGVYRLELNNQFGELQLHRRHGQSWQVVGKVANYDREPLSDYIFELRLAFAGRQVTAFIDDRELIRYADPDPVPADGAFGFSGGWGTDVAWRDFRLTSSVDASSSPLIGRPAPAEAGLVRVTWVRGLSPDSITFDGETNGLRCRLTTTLPQATDVRLRFELVDVWGRAHGQTGEVVTLHPGKELERTLAFAPTNRGCFKVVLTAGRGTNDLRWVEDLGSFTVVPKALYDRPRSAASYFGGHMDGIHLDWHLAAGRKLGIQWSRCHDMLQYTWWNRIQPDGPNDWKWGDGAQKQVDAQGFATLGEFLWTPKWAGKALQRPPADYDVFGKYVAETVGHHRGSIHYWEVWNEPHFSGFWQGTPEEYAKLLGVAYREAKKADPQCVVLGGGGVDLGNIRWLEPMLHALEGRPMDVFSIHYLSPDAAVPHLAKLRELLKAKGIAVPVWNTEASVLSASFLDQVRPEKIPASAHYTSRHACSELVRMYMGNLSHGVERVFYYNQADPWRFQQFSKPRVTAAGLLNPDMWDEGQMLKPIAAAHAALAYAIDGRRFVEEVSVNDARAFLFADKEQAVVVQLAAFTSFTEQKQLRLKLPAGRAAADFTIMDMMGNERPASIQENELVLPLSREPVYLFCRGAEGAEVLRGVYQGAR